MSDLETKTIGIKAGPFEGQTFVRLDPPLRLSIPVVPNPCDGALLLFAAVNGSPESVLRAAVIINAARDEGYKLSIETEGLRAVDDEFLSGMQT
ncbi:hypothetical protein ACFLZ1_04505 [Patescibacteria group bacterium]